MIIVFNTAESGTIWPLSFPRSVNSRGGGGKKLLFCLTRERNGRFLHWRSYRRIILARGLFPRSVKWKNVHSSSTFLKFIYKKFYCFSSFEFSCIKQICFKVGTISHHKPSVFESNRFLQWNNPKVARLPNPEWLGRLHLFFSLFNERPRRERSTIYVKATKLIYQLTR